MEGNTMERNSKISSREKYLKNIYDGAFVVKEENADASRVNLNACVLKSADINNIYSTNAVFRHEGKNKSFIINSPIDSFTAYMGEEVNIKLKKIGSERFELLRIERVSDGIVKDRINKHSNGIYDAQKYMTIYRKLNKQQKDHITGLLNRKDVNSMTFKSAKRELIELKYVIFKDFYSENVRSDIELILHTLKRGENLSSELKNNEQKRLECLVNTVSCADAGNLTNTNIEEALDRMIIGNKYAKKTLVTEAVKYMYDKEKRPPRLILLRGKSARTIIEAFAKAMERTTMEISLEGSGEALDVKLQGSSRVYSNATIGELAEKLMFNPKGFLIFSGMDNLTDGGKNVSSTINLLCEERIYNNTLLNTGLQLEQLWIFGIVNDFSKVDKEMLSYATVIDEEDYSENELIAYGKRYLEEAKEKYGMDVVVSDYVLKALCCKYIRKNNIYDIESNIDNVLSNALCKQGDRKLSIGKNNIKDYFDLIKERELLDKKNCKDINSLARKRIALQELYRYPIEVQKRMDELFDDRKLDEKYVLDALRRLVNTNFSPEVKIDIKKIREGIKEKIYGNEQLIETILDYLNRVKNKNMHEMQPLLLQSKPGCGKTVITRTIAELMDIPFVEIQCNSLEDNKTIDGVSKEHKISSPGLIWEKLTDEKKGVGIIFLDEIDKLRDFGPVLSLLGTSNEFYEKYFEVNMPKEFLIICTANDLGAIPSFIRNRCILARMQSYSSIDKINIARDYVIPRFTKASGKNIDIPAEVIKFVIESYMAYEGVRDIEKRFSKIIDRVCRTKANDYIVTIEDVKEVLGLPDIHTYNNIEEHHEGRYGVATALAALDIGAGCAFSIEALDYSVGIVADDKDASDKESVIVDIKGKIEDSARNSVYDAIYYAENHLGYKLTHTRIRFMDGGISVDGPSAGVAIAAAILSKEKQLDISMYAFTGEITPYGAVHPIGGLEYKLDAAEKLDCVKKVFIPYDNYIEFEYDGKLTHFTKEIIPLRTMDEFIKVLFEDNERKEK